MDHAEMKRALDRAKGSTIEERLLHHSKNCVEGELLRETVQELLSLRNRLAMAEVEITRLEREQYRA